MSQQSPEHGWHLPHFPHVPHPPGDWRTAVSFGFLGGVIPTLLKLASAFVAVEDIDMPRYTFWLAVIFYGLVGATVSAAFRQYTTREAFIAGIIAPSLVANLIGGYSEGSTKRSVRTGDVAPIIWSVPGLISVASAQELKGAEPGPFIINGAESLPDHKTIDFEWDLPRKNVVVGKVRMDLLKNFDPDSPRKTIYVSPSYSGTIELPADYKYILIEGAPPVQIPPGTSQLTISGNVRTSLTNDFVWALGGTRVYKLQNPSVAILPWSLAN
jgi:hypothetical protein